MSYMNREHLLNLADRCEAGANTLTYEAEHAAEVLAERGYPDADPRQWAARKTAAAAAARQYADGLRAEAAGMKPGNQTSPERIAQAEKVASAAELGGILIDDRRLVEAALERWSSEEMNQAVLDHYQAEREAIEGSGLFEHVAEDGQVPFWQLGGDTDQAQPASGTATDGQSAADDDADGM